MSKETGCTATLADLYARQGHYRKAMDIYRVLFRENPDREDYREALKDLATRAEKRDGTQSEEGSDAIRPGRLEALVPLFEQWVELLLQYDRLRRMKKIKERIAGSPPDHFKINP